MQNSPIKLQGFGPKPATLDKILELFQEEKFEVMAAEINIDPSEFSYELRKAVMFGGVDLLEAFTLATAYIETLPKK